MCLSLARPAAGSITHSLSLSCAASAQVEFATAATRSASCQKSLEASDTLHSTRARQQQQSGFIFTVATMFTEQFSCKIHAAFSTIYVPASAKTLHMSFADNVIGGACAVYTQQQQFSTCATTASEATSTPFWTLAILASLSCAICTISGLCSISDPVTSEASSAYEMFPPTTPLAVFC
jgi:hypothetical protein